MARCFVIQPFDQGKYDKRYIDIFKPAIEDAQLESYRVDQDPSVSIPVETIEKEINGANACLVEISEDNPNVWFELGMAISLGKECVLICSDERKTKYPFDVQHRKIISYATGSPSDFNILKEKITERLKTIAEKQSTLNKLPNNVVKDTMGLKQHEIVALVSIGQSIENLQDYVPIYTIRSDMDNSGFTRIATTIALNSLFEMGFLESKSIHNEDGDSYYIYKLTSAGMDWLMKNQDRFILKGNNISNNLNSQVVDDDIPF